MKKMITILTLVVSAGAFAQTMDHSAHGNMNTGDMDHSNMNHGGMMNQVANLTPEQQLEYNELHAKHRTDMQKTMLDIKAVNLNIQKEMISENPNQKNIDKLIDQKSKLQAERQKDMLSFKIKVKEKFGLEMVGGMMNGGKTCKMNGSKEMHSKGSYISKGKSVQSHH